MEGINLSKHLEDIEGSRDQWIQELLRMETLQEIDGHSIEKINKAELAKLLEEQEVQTGHQLGELAIHVLSAGRCAGSYGCGTDFSRDFTR